MFDTCAAEAIFWAPDAVVPIWSYRILLLSIAYFSKKWMMFTDQYERSKYQNT